MDELLLGLALDRRLDLDIGFESRTAELLLEQFVDLEDAGGVVLSDPA
jgi:hypothetical protein